MLPSQGRHAGIGFINYQDGSCPATLWRLVRGIALWTTVHTGVLAPFLTDFGTVGLRLAALLWLLSIVPAFVVLPAFCGAFYPSVAIRRWVSRPFWYVHLGLPLLSISVLLGWLTGLPFGVRPTLARYALTGVAGLLLLIVLAGYAGTYRFVDRRQTFAFPTLPAALTGLRIVQLSNLYIGPHPSRPLMRRIAQALKKAAPDLIVSTGNQVENDAADAVRFVDAFGALHAPLGLWAVAGNHDLFAGWQEVQRTLEAAGFIVLVHEARPLSYRGIRFRGGRPGRSRRFVLVPRWRLRNGT